MLHSSSQRAQPAPVMTAEVVAVEEKVTVAVDMVMVAVVILMVVEMVRCRRC